MPGTQPAATAAAPSLLLFDDDDDDFGDFTFAPSPNSLPPPQPQQQDDEWGDFVASPIGSHPSEPPTPSNPPSDPAPAAKPWERLQGALPLSLFGDEEEEDDAEPPIPPPPPPLILTNGFSSPSSNSAKDVIGSGGSKGDLKDLIVNLYGPVVSPASGNGAVAAGSNFDEWEFKDASSPGAEKEGNNFKISGFEGSTYENGNGIEFFGNRTGESWEASDQSRIGNVDAYVSHTGPNGFRFNSVIGYDNCFSETNLQTKHIDNGNGFKPSMVNGDKSGDDNCWEFKDSFSEVEAVTFSPGHKKISDTEAEVPTSTLEIQGTRNVWENDFGDFSVPPESNREKDPGGFKEHNGPSCEPAYIGFETKDFSSGASVVFNDIISTLYDKADPVYNVHPAQNSSENEPKSSELVPNGVSAYDDSEFDEIHWEFQKASVTTVGDQDSALRLDQSLSVGPMQNIFVDLYYRLREECLFLIVHHINDLKKSDEVTKISGEQAQTMEINEKIQAAYKKIQEYMVSENVYIGKYPSRDVCVSQLLDVVKGPNFQAIEQAYCLQERILSAGKDLMAAIELFEHTISVLQVLGSVSKEEVNAYITAWSKMASACSQELQHGAMIWAESLRANVSNQILSRGSQYFIALGEIFRVVEILRASLKLYRPWIPLCQDDSIEALPICLEKCAEVWTTSGLQAALESISNTTIESEGRVKPLIESIKLIQGFDEVSIRLHALGHDKIICKLSLLPIGVLQDIGAVVWNGEHYYTKLANLWANIISCDPPKLPHIHIG